VKHFLYVGVLLIVSKQMKPNPIIPNLLKQWTKVYFSLYFLKLLGVFDAVLIETKGSVSQSISEAVLKFLSEQHDWSKVVEALTGQKVSQSSKDDEDETSNSPSTKSSSNSKAGRKSIPLVKPSSDQTKNVGDVSFFYFLTVQLCTHLFMIF